MGVKLGFLGNGNMGYAILKGLTDHQQLDPQECAVYDPSEAARERAGKLGAHVCEDELALVSMSEAVLIAVKPQYAKALLAKIGKAMQGKLLLSIVAGYDAAYLRECLGTEHVRVLRIMPNTPAMAGAGAFGMDNGTDATAEERTTADAWFSALGLVEWIDESLFPVVTGLSGGGPAYVAMFIEALADGGVKYGLRRDVALRLAAQTVYGSAKLLMESGQHPGQIKDAVCSPAGTTIEGVQALEDGAFRSVVMKAVEAGTKKASGLK